MPRIHLERRKMGDELRRMFDLLERQTRASGEPAECTPPVDVLESAGAVEVLVDLPGVASDRIQIALAAGTLLIAGAKHASVCSHADAKFHLAERAFGRFAQAIRIGGAIDAGRARATFGAGVLRIVMPRIDERRGREIRIPIGTD